jgi:hypothetical protein
MSSHCLAKAIDQLISWSKKAKSIKCLHHISNCQQEYDHNSHSNPNPPPKRYDGREVLRLPNPYLNSYLSFQTNFPSMAAGLLLIVSRPACVASNLLAPRVRTASRPLFHNLVFGPHQFLSFIRHMAVHIFRLGIEHISDSALGCRILLGIFFQSSR